jgi:hypothetical protein
MLEVGAGVVRSGTYRLKAMMRGAQKIGDHYVRYASPAGFWIRQLRIPAETKLRVFPDVQAVRHYELLARQSRDHRTSRLDRMRGGDTEFERLRDYPARTTTSDASTGSATARRREADGPRVSSSRRTRTSCSWWTAAA